MLEFTHDALPPALAPPPGTPSCADTAGAVATDSAGRGYDCAAIAAANACGASPQFAIACRHSCGGCEGTRARDTEALASLNWTPLELPNLPSEPTLMPRWTSPYHYRISWEAWIQTTASQEHLVEQWLQHGKRQGSVPLKVPALINALLLRIMQGDTDAIGLVGGSNALVGGSNAFFEMVSNSTAANESAPDGGAMLRAPTAFRATLYSLTFGSWDDLAAGHWWVREPMSSPSIIEAPVAPLSEGAGATSDRERSKTHRERSNTRRSPQRERQRCLLICALGVALSLDTLCTRGAPRAARAGSETASARHSLGWWILSFGCFGWSFVQVLMADYAHSSPEHSQELSSGGLANGYLGMAKLTAAALAVRLVSSLMVFVMTRKACRTFRPLACWRSVASCALLGAACWTAHRAADRVALLRLL